MASQTVTITRHTIANSGTHLACAGAAVSPTVEAASAATNKSFIRLIVLPFRRPLPLPSGDDAIEAR